MNTKTLLRKYDKIIVELKEQIRILQHKLDSIDRIKFMRRNAQLIKKQKPKITPIISKQSLTLNFD